jgi:hypothetical protein
MGHPQTGFGIVETILFVIVTIVAAALVIWWECRRK